MDTFADVAGMNPSTSTTGVAPLNDETAPAQSKSGKSRRSISAAAIGYFVALLAIVAGWSLRNEQYTVAYEGLGYWLGIIGGSMILLLMLYPLRKKFRAMGIFGSVKAWFQAHMLLGVVGPLLVLYHANFRLGSLNSRVALISMIAVAVSGLIGRYLYAKIHHGLYGHRVTLNELMSDATTARKQQTRIDFLPQLDDRLLKIEKRVLQTRAGFLSSAVKPFVLTVSTRWAGFRLGIQSRREIRRLAAKLPVVAAHQQRIAIAAKRHIAERLAMVRKISQFAFYERLFSLWHVFHYPLFIILVVAAFVHILAVHMY